MRLLNHKKPDGYRDRLAYNSLSHNLTHIALQKRLLTDSLTVTETSSQPILF